MKISSFRLAEYFIRKFCSMHGLSFADLELEFSDISTPALNEGTILLTNKHEKLSRTIFQIIATYIDNIDIISASEIQLRQNYDKVHVNISNDKKVVFLNFVLSLLRYMSYGSEPQSDSKSSLNRFPFVWLVIRDIVSPVFAKGANNLDIIVQNTPYIDGARFFDKNEMPGIDKPTIVLNSSITNRSFSLAFLFVEAICAHDLNPVAVLHHIMTKKEVRDRFFGILELISFSSEDTDNFLSTLTALTNLEIEKPIKTAQTVGQTWWYVGLIEKILEPSRGSDTSVTDAMKDSTAELWAKIEDKKQKLGLNQLSLESLLRIQSEEYQNKPNLILQGLLSDVRVW